ncbi:MAG: MotA/TolQ/ExbB proton channel family protein [Burkholderiaceae bacterium]
MFDTAVQWSKDSWGLLPLMACVFIIGLSIVIERAVYLSKTIKNGLSLEYDLLRVKRGDTVDGEKVAKHYANTFQGDLVKTALENKGQSSEELERKLDESIMFQLPKLDRNLWMLDTAVTLGPLLGLLGTIIGMIESFNVLGAAGVSNPTGVTGGIAHALIATAVGLSIAIVCVVPLNYFTKRIRLVVNQLDLIKAMLIDRYAA